MPFDWASGQAAGLRRLLPTTLARGWNVTGARPGVGVTTLVVQLARALARQGHQVLVLDQQRSAHNVGNLLGLRPRHDLLDAMQGDCRWSQVLLSTRQGVDVLPMARTALWARSGEQHSAWQEAVQLLLPQYDVILTDALPESALLEGQRSLLVLEATSEGLQQGYALIKRWVREKGTARPLELAWTRTRDAAQGQILFDNLARATQHFLSFTPVYAGQFPLDPALRDTSRTFDRMPGLSGLAALARLTQAVQGCATQPWAP